MEKGSLCPEQVCPTYGLHVANDSYECSPTQNCKLNVNIMRILGDFLKKNLIMKFP